jgi:hypothetical protein
MAREESNREDLLAEATALVHRIELAATDGSTVVVGFRAGGEFSAFFGQDPAYHFNRSDELRRAYCGGLLIKAAGRRLFSLKRVRTEEESQLVRHALSDAEQESFISEMTRRLRELQAMLAAGAFEAGRQVPADFDVLKRVRSWLQARRSWQIAEWPNV